MKPTIGIIVLYTSYGTPHGEYLPESRAAIVTEVAPVPDPQTLGLCILNPTGMFFNRSVPHAPGDIPTPGHWNWPPRVEGE